MTAELHLHLHYYWESCKKINRKTKIENISIVLTPSKLEAMTETKFNILLNFITSVICKRRIPPDFSPPPSSLEHAKFASNWWLLLQVANHTQILHVNHF